MAVLPSKPRLFRLLIWVAILVWPFGQLLILPSTSSSLRWYALDLMALLIGAYLLLWPPLRARLPQEPLFKPILIFVSVLGLSLLLALPTLKNGQVLIAGAYWLRLVFLSLMYFGLRILDKGDKKMILFGAIGIFLLLGFGQYLFIPDTRSLAMFGFDDHYYRLVGSLFDPNFTGLIMAAFTLIALHHFDGRQKLIALVPLLGLALTFSRASYLAFAVGLIFLVIKKRWWYFLGFLPLLAAILLIIPKPFGEGVNLLRTFSISSRLNNQMEGWNMFLEKPLFGHGFNTLPTKQPTLSEKFTPIRVGGIDNSFLYILATSGIVGLAAFLYLIWSLWKLAEWTPVVQAVLLAVLVHSLWNNSFFYSWIYVLILILCDYASGRVAKAK